MIKRYYVSTCLQSKPSPPFFFCLYSSLFNVIILPGLAFFLFTHMISYFDWLLNWTLFFSILAVFSFVFFFPIFILFPLSLMSTYNYIIKVGQKDKLENKVLLLTALFNKSISLSEIQVTLLKISLKTLCLHVFYNRGWKGKVKFSKLFVHTDLKRV
jgi:hypothetical protein